MANVLICEPRLSDAAILAASGASAGFPVAGLQRRQLYHAWRPAGPTAWLTIDLRAARDVRSLALVSSASREVPDPAADCGWRIEGTASAGATWRVRGADEADDLESDPGYDSGAVPFRMPGALDIDPVVIGFMWVADGILPRPHRFWRIDFDDSGNPAGFVDFGRLYVSDAEPFGIHISRGASAGYDDASRINRSVAGNTHVVKRRPAPVLDFAIDWGTEAEMMGFALELDRRRGIAGDVLAIWDFEREQFRAQGSVYGQFESLAPVTRPWWRTYSKRYRIRGILP